MKPEPDADRFGKGAFWCMAGAAGPASGSFGIKLMAMNTSDMAMPHLTERILENPITLEPALIVNLYVCDACTSTSISDLEVSSLGLRQRNPDNLGRCARRRAPTG